MSHTLAGVAGFEPTNGGIKTRCLTAWLYPKKSVVSPLGFEPKTHGLEGRCSIQLSYGPTLYHAKLDAVSKKIGADDENRTHTTSLEGWSSTIELHPHILERKTRFELATLALARRCSTPEPLPHTFWWREMDSNHRKLS